MRDTKIVLLFLVGCIGMRTVLALSAFFVNPEYLPYMGYVGLVVATSFFYLYMHGNKYADGQLKKYGEKMVWWNKYRPIHGVLYLTFGILAIGKNNYSWVPLGLDVIVGLSLWLHHNYNNNNNYNIKN